MNLDTEITYIPGVGPKRAALLNKELSIYSVEDLLTYFPTDILTAADLHHTRSK